MNDKYLKVELIGGLCNKLFCFFSAVSIALTEDYILIEPDFGWKVNVNMSSVWNVDKLCNGIPELKWCSSEDFRSLNIDANKIFNKSGAELWAYSEANLLKQRQTCILNRNEDVCCRILTLLEPATCIFTHYNNSVNDGGVNGVVRNDGVNGMDRNDLGVNKVAVHFRTESDWKAYSVKKQRSMPPHEYCWTDNGDICNMVVSKFGKDITMFIVSCEHGNEITNILQDMGVISEYNYKPELEYEQNAAMHWYICCMATGGFVGLSRSTFSNLICLRRELDGITGDCWIYNYQTEHNGNCEKTLHKRVDAGLQPVAYDSITKVTHII